MTKQNAINSTAKWTSITLQNGWSNYGSGLANAHYSIDSLQIVRLMGVVKGPGAANSVVIFNLPAGFRPLSLKAFRVLSPDPSAYMAFDSSGNVSIVCTAAGAAYIYLDNIVFPVY